MVNGETATASGLETMPLVLGVVIMSILSGQLISRTGWYVPWIYLAGILATTGAALMSTLDETTPRVAQIFYLLIAGMGIGSAIQVRVIGIQASVDLPKIAIATAMSNFAQTMGGYISPSTTRFD